MRFEVESRRGELRRAAKCGSQPPGQVVMVSDNVEASPANRGDEAKKPERLIQALDLVLLPVPRIVCGAVGVRRVVKQFKRAAARSIRRPR